LYTVVIIQAVLSLTLGFGGAVGLVLLFGLVLPLAVPGVGLTLTQAALTRVLLASAFIGTIAALIPAWHVARLDPAQVFGG
jgi:ABC-type antimicrobial peptide transport system permease subunit